MWFDVKEFDLMWKKHDAPGYSAPSSNFPSIFSGLSCAKQKRKLTIWVPGHWVGGNPVNRGRISLVPLTQMACNFTQIYITKVPFGNEGKSQKMDSSHSATTACQVATFEAKSYLRRWRWNRVGAPSWNGWRLALSLLGLGWKVRIATRCWRLYWFNGFAHKTWRKPTHSAECSSTLLRLVSLYK